MRRSTAPISNRFADLADAKIQSRIHRVHQRRLAHSRRAGEDRSLSRELVMELVQTNALLDAREMQRISGRYVIAEGAFRSLSIHKLDLVDDDSRLKRIPFGDHQEPVEHSAVRLRPRGREDDDDLVDVGGDNALTLPFTRFASREL